MRSLGIELTPVQIPDVVAGADFAAHFDEE